jgi:hypothetical protein
MMLTTRRKLVLTALSIKTSGSWECFAGKAEVSSNERDTEPSVTLPRSIEKSWFFRTNLNYDVQSEPHMFQQWYIAPW